MTGYHELYRTAIRADNAYHTALVRQFGDPDTWEIDYRYYLGARHFWNEETIDAYLTKIAADKILQSYWRKSRSAT